VRENSPINPAEKELKITLTPDKSTGETYLPGDTAEYQVSVTDVQGQPVKAELSLDERARIWKEPTRDIRAYQFYLKGRQCYGRYTDESIQQGIEYWTDAAQRSALYLDTMRKRGNIYIEHGVQGKPALLKFEHELLIDGTKLERPCNYSLLRILPDAQSAPTLDQRPVVIVDPRAGHGPGIGGFKPDSQVGMAMRAGHPVYFVTFSPEPVEGQLLVDVAAAEAHFIEEVQRRHPASGKPAVIGNCQAGWAVAALASLRPEIMGPIVLNGAPLSYWAGSAKQNPMRYSGGVLGGSWMAAFASDLGAGRFDGAHLVKNFEAGNPANTYWSKDYNLYSKIDTEEARFLDFERWWGGHFRMTGEEIENIVNNLFVGNKLARGEVVRGDMRVDLRNITSPVVVFASWGDDITPPQQALNWIIDVWGDEKAIIEAGRTIVYTLHEKIGHLGIFVGGAVARKEHDQIVNTLEQIDRLPPGLYEMLIDDKSGTGRYEELEHGEDHHVAEHLGDEDHGGIERSGHQPVHAGVLALEQERALCADGAGQDEGEPERRRDHGAIEGMQVAGPRGAELALERRCRHRLGQRGRSEVER